MKALPIILVTCSAAAQAGTVTLTSNGVTSALDIEAAINTATNFGTTPGEVILDGIDGDFVYAHPDTSINMFVSNLTLRGINGATIANCDDGLFFDNIPVTNILVENIRFQCFGNGIDDNENNTHSNVTIRNNVFQTNGLIGIEIYNSNNWKILNNTVSAPGEVAIVLANGVSSEIVGNRIIARYGISFFTFNNFSSANHNIVANNIEADETGVILSGVSNSHVRRNRIFISGLSGICISLGPDTRQNRVKQNRGSIVPGGSLTTVQDLGTDNKVSGNKP